MARAALLHPLIRSRRFQHFVSVLSQSQFSILHTAQKSNYPPGNHLLTTGTDDPTLWSLPERLWIVAFLPSVIPLSNALKKQFETSWWNMIGNGNLTSDLRKLGHCISHHFITGQKCETHYWEKRKLPIFLKETGNRSSVIQNVTQDVHLMKGGKHLEYHNISVLQTKPHIIYHKG